MAGAGWKDPGETIRCDSTRRSRERSSCRWERSPHRWARRCRRTVGGMCVLGALGAGVAASAQEPEAPSRLVVEEIRSGFVVAPELKLTSIDGGAGAVTGMYGGLITDRRLLIGVGAYWLTNGPGSVDMRTAAASSSGSRTLTGGWTSACGDWSGPVGQRLAPTSAYRCSVRRTAMLNGCLTLDVGVAGKGAMRRTTAIQGGTTSRGRVRSPSATARTFWLRSRNSPCI